MYVGDELYRTVAVHEWSTYELLGCYGYCFKWDLKRMRLIREGKTVLLFREIDSMCFIPEKQIPQIKNANAMWTIIMTKEKLCVWIKQMSNGEISDPSIY